jgi:sugar PTS system EIIA component
MRGGAAGGRAGGRQARRPGGAEEGARVRAGQPLIRWDPAAVAASGRSPICPVVALDAPKDALTDLREDGDVAIGEVLFVWS